MAKKLYTTLGIALVYVLTAQLGFLLSLLPFWEVTLLWPPSGISLAALLFLGRAALPGIFLGALATNLIVLPGMLSPGIFFVVSVTIATTSTLAPLAAATAIRRIVSNRPNEVTGGQLFAASFTNFLACGISTAGGTISLYLAGVIPQESFLVAAGMWWLGDFCGMMILGPICWVVVYSLRSSRRGAARDPVAIALLVNSAFVATSLLVFMTLWSFEAASISRLLASEAKLAANRVSLNLQEAERDIETLRTFVYASESFSIDEFRRYTTTELRHRQQQVAQAVGWAPRVTDPKAWGHEVQDGIPAPATLYELDDSGKQIPVTQREEYFPIQYIHPMEGNRAAIGFDLGSEPSRRMALERARDSGRASMVSPISLVQSVEAEPGMLICVPIYRPGVPLETVQERRANLTGFASAVYFIRPLFTGGLAGTNPDMKVHLFEGSQTGEANWYHSIDLSFNGDHDTDISPGPEHTLANLQAGPNGTTVINFAGHHWLVVTTPGATLLRNTRTWLPWAGMILILALGILISSVFLERISTRRRVMIERRKTGEAFLEARAANDSRTFFLAAAGHDIKQPLYALGILTDTLLMSNPKASSVPILQHLRKSIDAMAEQFDDLMLAGKLNKGIFEPAFAKVRLAGIVAPVDSEIALLCADKGLRWNLDLDNALVFTDRLLLQRLLRNLLSNAVRYTEDGKVSCSAKARDTVVEFRVSDTGSGMLLAEQKEMFDEFVLRGNYTRDSSSTGLGLSIVAKINLALDLRMQISSTPGKGTTFNFEIPRASEN